MYGVVAIVVLAVSAIPSVAWSNEPAPLGCGYYTCVGVSEDKEECENRAAILNRLNEVERYQQISRQGSREDSTTSQDPVNCLLPPPVRQPAGPQPR